MIGEFYAVSAIFQPCNGGYWINKWIKNEDCEHFLLKILPPQKVVPSKLCFYLNTSFFFVACCFVCIVLFKFAYIHTYIRTTTVIDIFYINWSVRNCLKSWRVTYTLKVTIEIFSLPELKWAFLITVCQLSVVFVVVIVVVVVINF